MNIVAHTKSNIMRNLNVVLKVTMMDLKEISIYRFESVKQVYALVH
jgi:hypothetical protein